MAVMKVLGVKIKFNNFYFAHIILVVCIKGAFTQFVGQQTPQFHQNHQLSPQQQGHILSDIQQHQHRFNLNPTLNPTIQPSNSHQYNPQQFADQRQFIGANQPQFLQNQPVIQLSPTQQIIQNQQLLNQNQQQLIQNQQFLNGQGLVPTLPPIQPTISSPNRIVQHHTQTSFTPNFAANQQDQIGTNLANPKTTVSTVNSHQIFQSRPTVDPVLSLNQQIQQLDPEKEKQRIKELKEKQAIIDKHNQFVEKQYEKALKKAQNEHQDFVEQQKDQRKKLYQKLYKPGASQNVKYLSQSIPRYIYPEEAPLFKLAVEQYYKEHPTTTTTTTTTTTEAPTTVTTTTEGKPPKKSKSFLPTVLPTVIKPIQTLEDLNQLQKQYKSQQIAKDDLLAQLRLAIENSPDDNTPKNYSSREISPKIDEKPNEEITLPNGQTVQILKNNLNNLKLSDEITLPSGQRIQVIKTDDPKLIASSSVKSQEITLPNGEKVEIYRTTDPKLVPGATPLEPGSDLEKLLLSRTTTTTTTSKPPKAILDELTKGVIPPGANFELLKTGASGSLEQIGGIPSNLPNQKKVTFVLLEEQSDGTLKVQGVKGSGKDESEVDVDSILKRIKEGQIKLPTPSSTQTTLASNNEKVVTAPKKEDISGVSVVPNSFATSEDAAKVPILKTNIGTHFVATSTPSSTLYTKIFTSTRPSVVTTTKQSIPPTVREPRILNHSSNDLLRQASTSSASNQNSILPSPTTKINKLTTTPTVPTSTVTIYQSVSSTLPPKIETETGQQLIELPDVLKKNGLYAMAKFLRQSGLDTILNETGPYTVFVPTDKAFRTLLVQLGGPEKAEEKFKENPRLLSGLLLHHVIPGAFTISTLQDEMTGVSLAGTQLRVNQYNMHDLEWNDIKITTINGAKVLDEKKDIEIPQGVAHAIDRVMFPLPVGDIVQTLQSDRERRFTSFLRAIFSSGLAETLQGTKTFSLFAPTDKAFANLSSEDLSRTVTDRTLARELVLKHLIPGTLYTNGMRYYQIRESLLNDKQITLSKQSGKVKINNAQITTQNIPATNGVIHAIDSVL